MLACIVRNCPRILNCAQHKLCNKTNKRPISIDNVQFIDMNIQVIALQKNTHHEGQEHICLVINSLYNVQIRKFKFKVAHT